MANQIMVQLAKLIENRVASLDDSVVFSMEFENIKPAYMRKKVMQGKNSDSQK